MFDGDVNSPDVREAINATLRDVLGTDGWTQSNWDALIKNLREEFGIETDLLELAQNAPGLIEMFQIGALYDKGIIKKGTRETLTQIIHQLVRIAYRSEKGDEKASNQLKALHKLAYPFNYELPATVIKNLVDSYHISPHLARAWSIRRLMVDLSFVVESIDKTKSVLKSPIRLATGPRKFDIPERYEKVARHIKKNSTLQSLAIDIYIEELEKEGISLEPRQLKLDLQKLKAWEATNLTDPSDRLGLYNAGGSPFASLPPIPIYSEGWKLRWKRGDKK